MRPALSCVGVHDTGLTLTTLLIMVRQHLQQPALQLLGTCSARCKRLDLQIRQHHHRMSALCRCAHDSVCAASALTPPALPRPCREQLKQQDLVPALVRMLGIRTRKLPASMLVVGMEVNCHAAATAALLTMSRLDNQLAEQVLQELTLQAWMGNSITLPGLVVTH